MRFIPAYPIPYSSSMGSARNATARLDKESVTALERSWVRAVNWAAQHMSSDYCAKQ
ncbi:MAG: hypothetical protein ACYC8W_02665 [Candidatus Tyrphobacter sp.]